RPDHVRQPGGGPAGPRRTAGAPACRPGAVGHPGPRPPPGADRVGGAVSGAGGGAVVAVDLSCSGLTVASASSSSVLAPTVAPVSVLAAADGSALPPGGDRIECSERVDAVASRNPGHCLADPVSAAHRDRLDVAGLSVPTAESLAAPVARALRWAGPRRGAGVVVLVPSAWRRTRTTRTTRAVPGRGGGPALVLGAVGRRGGVLPDPDEGESGRTHAARIDPGGQGRGAPLGPATRHRGGRRGAAGDRRGLGAAARPAGGGLR